MALKPRSSIAIVAAWLIFGACAGASDVESILTPKWVTYDLATRSPGPPVVLELSSERAHFDKLVGDLQLQYAGSLPASDSIELSNAEVYKVQNAAEYFAKNKSIPEVVLWYCGQPAAYMTIRKLGPFPAEYHAPPLWVRIAFIHADSFSDIGPVHVCSGNSYTPREK